MEALMGQIGDISVDQIIERVMIRSNQQHYDYTHKNEQKLTPPQHIWHFQLQEENIELKGKVQKLRSMLKKKQDQLQKQLSMQKQISDLKQQLDNLLKENAQLQKGINKLRLKNNHNSQINETLHDSLEESLRNRKTIRQCSCNSQLNLNRTSPLKKISNKQKFVTVIESPAKEILKTTKEVSINCKLEDRNIVEQGRQRLAAKKKQIAFLEQMVANQQKIIQQYEKQIETSRKKNVLGKKYTQATTERVYPLMRPTSMKTLMTASAAGSIVKIKRK